MCLALRVLLHFILLIDFLILNQSCSHNSQYLTGIGDLSLVEFIIISYSIMIFRKSLVLAIFWYFHTVVVGKTGLQYLISIL